MITVSLDVRILNVFVFTANWVRLNNTRARSPPRSPKVPNAYAKKHNWWIYEVLLDCFLLYYSSPFCMNTDRRSLWDCSDSLATINRLRASFCLIIANYNWRRIYPRWSKVYDDKRTILHNIRDPRATILIVQHRHSCPQKPRSFCTAPRIVTTCGMIQFSENAQRIHFVFSANNSANHVVRLDSEHAQSDGKSQRRPISSPEFSPLTEEPENSGFEIERHQEVSQRSRFLVLTKKARPLGAIANILELQWAVGL